MIAEVDGWTVYDALADGAQGRELLHRIRGSADVAGEHGSIRFRWAGSAAGAATAARSRCGRSASSSPTPRSSSATS